MKLVINVYLPGGGLGTDESKLAEQLSALEWLPDGQMVLVYHAATAPAAGYAEVTIHGQYELPGDVVPQVQAAIEAVHSEMEVAFLT